MKIKLDENLPSSLRHDLQAFVHDVDTVMGEGLLGKPDADVQEAAARAGRFLITQDLDFSDIRRLDPDCRPGVMILRLDQPDRQALIARVREVFASNPVDAWSGRLIIVTDTKIRVRPS